MNDTGADRVAPEECAIAASALTDATRRLVVAGVDTVDCRRYVDRAVDLARRAGADYSVLGDALHVDAQVGVRERDYARAETAALESIRFYRARQMYNHAARSYITYAQSTYDNMLDRGDLSEARRRLQAGLAIAERGRRGQDKDVATADLCGMLCDLDRKAGAIAEFRRHARVALDLHWRLEAYGDICETAAMLAMILIRTGPITDALACSLGALQHTRAADVRTSRLNEAGLLYNVSGDPLAAARCALASFAVPGLDPISQAFSLQHILFRARQMPPDLASRLVMTLYQVLGADLAATLSADRPAEFRAAQAAPEEVRMMVTAEVLAMDAGHLGDLVGIDLLDAEDFVTSVIAEQDIEATYRLVRRILVQGPLPDYLPPLGLPTGGT
jgi:hypothetical protein